MSNAKGPLNQVELDRLVSIIGRNNVDDLLHRGPWVCKRTRYSISFSLQRNSGVLFNRQGWRVPAPGMKKIRNSSFRSWEYPDMLGDYQNCYEYLMAIYGAISENGLIPKCNMDLSTFVCRAESLAVELHQNKEAKQILRGPHWPIFLPKVGPCRPGDLLEAMVLKIADVCKGMPNLSFVNYFDETGLGELDITPESRFADLWEQMRKREIVGLYFPCALNGYPPEAQLAQMDSLPYGFVLSGLDTVISWLMTPAFMIRFDSNADICGAFRYDGKPLCFYNQNTDVRFDVFPDSQNMKCRLSGGLFYVGGLSI